MGVSLVYWQAKQQAVSDIANQQTVSVERQSLTAQILAGGVVPTRQAAKLDPIVALRGQQERAERGVNRRDQQEKPVWTWKDAGTPLTAMPLDQT